MFDNLQYANIKLQLSTKPVLEGTDVDSTTDLEFVR